MFLPIRNIIKQSRAIKSHLGASATHTILRKIRHASQTRANWGEFSTGDYTSVVTDMIDEDFESLNDATNYGFIDARDQVYGYTIKQIEDVLSDTSSWNEWKNNIENRYENDTEEHLDRLFRAYE